MKAAGAGRYMAMSSGGLEILVGLASHELMLFASLGILLIGFDDLLFDILWIVTRKGRGGPGFLRDMRGSGQVAGPLAVFVPAWDESDVLPTMIARTLSAW